MERPSSIALFNAFAEPAVLVRGDGTISSVNSAFEDLSGRNTQQLRGVDLSNLLQISGDWKLCGNEGQRHSFQMLKGDGCQIKGWLFIRRFEPEAGIAAFLLVIKSQTVLDAEALREALAFVVSAVPHPLTLWDNDSRLLEFNEQARKLYAPVAHLFHLGQERATLLNAAYDAGIFGQSTTDHPYSREDILSLPENDLCAEGPIVNIAEVAPERWFKATAYFSKGSWGASFFEDISDLKRIQSELDAQGKFFELILENVPDFVVVLDGELRISFVNKAYAEVSGDEPARLIGDKCSIFQAEFHGQPVEAMIRAATPENPAFFFDHRIVDRTGSPRWVRWRTRVLFSNGRMTGVIKVGRDITVEYEQEANLRQQSADLKKKNESLEQFAAVVSHDLKAPLRHIAIFAEMIGEDTAKQKYENLSTYATQVHKSAVRMDRVIRRLLEYSQIAYKVVSRQQFAFADIVIQSVQNLESQIEAARAEILVSDMPKYHGDPELLRQVMQNLIANAVKYGRQGVRPRVRIYSANEGANILIYIEDNGIGIDPKFSESIFTAFQRLHKDETVYDGFGIGLALCKQIVESHYGTIRLDTSYKAGARFVVKLPTSEQWPE